jgi:peptide/nickel transport system substrate-binding protein
MRTSSKRLGGLVAMAVASVLVVSACSSSKDTKNEQNFSPGFAECVSKPTTCNSGNRKAGGTIVFAVNKAVQNWNQFAGDGNLAETVLIENGIVPAPYFYQPNGVIEQTDMITEAKVTSTDPQQVVTYKIAPNAAWNDGVPITADDFAYMWRLQNNKDCKKCNVAGTVGYESISSIEGADNGKTVKVTFSEKYPDWKGLFSLFPSHLVTSFGDLKTEASLLKSFDFWKDLPKWSGGAYTVDKLEKDVQVELVPNPKWYGKTKPTLDRVIFKMISDQSQNVPALQNKEINGFTAQPDADTVTTLKGLSGAGVGYEVSAGFGWEHIDINTSNKFLSDLPLRQAIFTAISANDIINKTIKPFFPAASQMGSHNIIPGTPGYQDIVKKVAPDQGSGNADKAKKILTDAGYTIDGGKLKTKAGEAVPELRFRYRKGIQTRQQSAEIVQSELKNLGVSMKIETTDDLSSTLDQQDYDLIIFAWTSTPLLTPSKDLWKTGGGNNKTGWGDPQSDALLDKMSQELDDTKLRDELNQQDEIMTKAAVVLPLYQKPNLLALSTDYTNIRDNNAGSYVSYNIENWGALAK